MPVYRGFKSSSEGVLEPKASYILAEGEVIPSRVKDSKVKKLTFNFLKKKPNRTRPDGTQSREHSKKLSYIKTI